MQVVAHVSGSDVNDITLIGLASGQIMDENDPDGVFQTKGLTEGGGDRERQRRRRYGTSQY